MQLTKKMKKELFARASKFLEKIAELVFAGAILAGILKQDLNVYWLVGGGFLLMLFLLSISFAMFINSKK